MNTYVTEPNRGGAMTYPQWLLWRMANPNVMCGPDVIDTRAWWQHLPLLNPYAKLEAQVRAAERDPARQADPRAPQAHPQAEAEAG